MVHSYGLTRAAALREDQYRDIETYAPAALVLGNALTADFVTDFQKKKKIHSRHWRAQYATVPTVLQIRYSFDDADHAARSSLANGNHYFRLLEFSKKSSLLETRQRLSEISKNFNAEVEVHRIAKSVVLFTVNRTAGD